jgi:hypothetical protein
MADEDILEDLIVKEQVADAVAELDVRDDLEIVVPGENKRRGGKLLRIGLWVLAILLACALAFAATTYIAGFGSIPEMIGWLRDNLYRLFA